MIGSFIVLTQRGPFSRTLLSYDLSSVADQPEVGSWFLVPFAHEPAPALLVELPQSDLLTAASATVLPALSSCDAPGIYPNLGANVTVLWRSLERQLLGWDDALAAVRFLQTSQAHNYRRARFGTSDQTRLLDQLQLISGQDSSFARHSDAARKILLECASGLPLQKALLKISTAERRLMFDQGLVVDAEAADSLLAPHHLPLPSAGNGELIVGAFGERAAQFAAAMTQTISAGGSAALIVSSDVLADQYQQLLDKQYHLPVIRWPSASGKHLPTQRPPSVWLSTRQFSSVILPEVSLTAIDLGIPGEWPFFWQRFSMRSLVAIVRHFSRAQGMPCMIGTTVPTLSVLDACGLTADSDEAGGGSEGRAKFVVRTQSATQQAPVASGILLKPTLTALRATYELGRTALLLLNIRGLATVIECAECGYTATCPICGTTLTLSGDRTRLYCKQCGHSESPPDVCPNCHGTQLRSRGYGLDRLARELQHTFPVNSIEILRTADEKAPVAVGAARLYLGTYADVQRISALSPDLVVFPDVSVGLRHPVFDNVEQLAAVVRGAVREASPSSVVVQLDRRSLGLQQALDGRYPFSSFLKEEALQRQGLLMPPFARQFSIRVPWRGEAQGAEETASLLQEALRTEHVTPLGLHADVLSVSPRSKVLSLEFRADAAEPALELRVNASLRHTKLFQNALIRIY